MQELPAWFLQRLAAINGKRPRVVAEHILKYGAVTTEELETLYGYKHAPRAARDLREQGIPLETYRVKNAEGRSIAAYRFADLAGIRRDRLAGRTVFARAFKQALLERDGARCAICGGKFEPRYLQIDHRVPYDVSGDPIERRLDDYQLLCGECNRAKSWSCEHCANWLADKRPELCLTCYWASPQQYTHIALRSIRRVDILWDENEIASYDRLKRQADETGETMPEAIRKLVRRALGDE